MNTEFKTMNAEEMAMVTGGKRHIRSISTIRETEVAAWVLNKYVQAKEVVNEIIGNKAAEEEWNAAQKTGGGTGGW